MHRICLVVFAAMLVWLSLGELALAQEGPPPWPTGAGDYGDPLLFKHGPGFYLSWFWILVCWLVFLAWIKTTDWMNQDAQRTKNNFLRWNGIAVGAFMGAAVLLWILPWFWMSFLLLLAAYGAPLGLYIFDRNKKANPADRVLTKEHIRFWLSEKLRPLGVKIEAEVKAKTDEPPIKFTAQGGAEPRDNAANLIKARQTPGFYDCGKLIIEALKGHASSMMLDFTPQAVAVRHQVDGVWNEAGSRDRAVGDSILEVLKTLCALKPAERVAKQTGTFLAEHEKNKYTCRLVSQGIKTGERAILVLDDGSIAKWRMPDCGMSQKSQDALKAVLMEKKGFVLSSAPAGGGLTSMLNVTVAGVDRYMRSVVSVEDVATPEISVENVPPSTFDGAAGQTPASVLPQIIRQYPDVYVVPLLADAPTVTILCEQVGEEHLVIGGIHAKETAEALLRVLMLKVPIKQFTPVVTAVVNQRLVRKLCATCKESFEPPPQLAQQLAAAGHKVEKIFRPPSPPKAGGEEKPPCKDCAGTGYKGRTGVVELLIIDDGVRAALLNKPTLETVRQAARKTGMKNLQEEGLALVAAGVTSVNELIRVLKE